MQKRLSFEILPQPDLTSCGPTCLHAVYRYFGLEQDLDQLIAQVPVLEGGGTLSVSLGCHAMDQGFRACMYTFNLHLFDPSWFTRGRMSVDVRDRLRKQMAIKDDRRLREATPAYLEFLERGGDVRLTDLTPGLIRKYLKRGIPVLTGLSATYLYRSPRELQDNLQEDDVRGEPTGHFVVLCGYDRASHLVDVADPYLPNPLSDRPIYPVSIDRVVCSVLLGLVTYDANLLILEPPGHTPDRPEQGV